MEHNLHRDYVGIFQELIILSIYSLHFCVCVSLYQNISPSVF